MRRLATALYPAAFGVSYILLSFREIPAPTVDLVRPMIVILLLSPAVVVALVLPLGGWHRAAIVTSALIIGLSAPYIFVAVIAAGIVVTAVQLLRRRWSVSRLRSGGAAGLSRLAATFGAAFLAVSVVMSAPAILDGVVAVDPPPREAHLEHAPNIYLILLDAYPRSDTLMEVYGYDNRWFELELESMGFTVASQSRSNYPHTWLTLASTLHGAYIDAIDGLAVPPDRAQDEFRRLMHAISDAAMVQVLRGYGYQTAAIPSPFRSSSLLAADEYFDSRHLTSFEYSLLMHSQLGVPIARLAPDFLMSQERGRFHATLARISQLSREKRANPTFLLAHVFSPPHAPFLYAADGEHLPLPPCVPTSCTLWEVPHEDSWELLSGQIHYANQELLRTLTDVVEADPDALIVLMADHGSRRSLDDRDEFYHTFFAARTPGLELFPNDISAVNVLRLIVAELSGQNLDERPYQAWFYGDERRPLVLIPVAPAP